MLKSDSCRVTGNYHHSLSSVDRREKLYVHLASMVYRKWIFTYLVPTLIHERLLRLYAAISSCFTKALGRKSQAVDQP